MDKKQYKKLVKSLENKSKVLPDCMNAFWVGGLICTVGQILLVLYSKLPIDEKTAQGLVSVSLIALSILFTGLSLYQKLANIGGAGTLVPITGFANAMSSPAVEFKTEGFVMGVGANIFKIAGPVIVYGTIASVIYGVVYRIMQIL